MWVTSNIASTSKMHIPMYTFVVLINGSVGSVGWGKTQFSRTLIDAGLKTVNLQSISAVDLWPTTTSSRLYIKQNK